jgi:hypothetical protein
MLFVGCLERKQVTSIEDIGFRVDMMMIMMIIIIIIIIINSVLTLYAPN